MLILKKRMGNKLDKFLISLSGLMLVALGVLGLKFEKEAIEIEKLKEDLAGSLVSAQKVGAMIDLQKELETARLEKLQKVDTAQIGTKTQTKVQTVVIPGKTVTQKTTVPSTSSSSSSKTSKTTKTS